MAEVTDIIAQFTKMGEDFKKNMEEWIKKAQEEMKKFMGDFPIMDMLKESFEDLVNITKKNFEALKSGKIDADFMKSNMEEIKKFFEKNLEKITSKMKS
jgi:hypothetical protein